MGISEKEEYENYKHVLKKSMVNDLENKIKIMELLYNIKKQKTLSYWRACKFQGFIEEFFNC